MAPISCDKINYHKVSKYANVLIFKEFYPKTKYNNAKRSILAHFTLLNDAHHDLHL